MRAKTVVVMGTLVFALYAQADQGQVNSGTVKSGGALNSFSGGNSAFSTQQNTVPPVPPYCVSSSGNQAYSNGTMTGTAGTPCCSDGTNLPNANSGAVTFHGTLLTNASCPICTAPPSPPGLPTGALTGTWSSGGSCCAINGSGLPQAQDNACTTPYCVGSNGTTSGTLYNVSTSNQCCASSNVASGSSITYQTGCPSCAGAGSSPSSPGTWTSPASGQCCTGPKGTLNYTLPLNTTYCTCGGGSNPCASCP